MDDFNNNYTPAPGGDDHTEPQQPVMEPQNETPAQPAQGTQETPREEP